MRPSDILKNGTFKLRELVELDKRFIDKEEFNSKLEQIKELINNIIEFREGEEKNNNIYRASQDDLNEDFIEALEQLKKKIEEMKGEKCQTIKN